MNMSNGVADILANFFARALRSLNLSHGDSLAFLQSNAALTRTLAGTGIGSGALATDWQALTVAHATVTAQVHQALDRHRDLTAQITFGGELAHLVTQTLKLIIGQVLDLLGDWNPSSLTNQTGTWTPDAINGGETNVGVLVAGDVDTGNTSHSNAPSLTLTLLMTRVGADNPHDAVSLDDLAVAADAPYRCENFHDGSFGSFLLRSENNSGPRQVVGREFHSDLVTGKNPDVMHAHLPRDVTQHHVAILEFHSEGGIGQVLDDLALHLDGIVFRHY
jgi:hypothetical protein